MVNSIVEVHVMSGVVLVDIGIGKTKVSAFKYHSHVAAVSADAFMGNASLTSIELPDVDIFQNGVFSGCKSLQSLVLPAIDYTNADLFGKDVPNIKTLLFKKSNDSVLKLGNSFSRLSSLENVCFDNALAEFDCNSLVSAKNLKKLDLGNICKVAENALSGLASLEEVRLPAQQSIKTYGLQHLHSLKKVAISINEEDALSFLQTGMLNDVHADEIVFENSGNSILAIQWGALSGLNVQKLDFHLSKLHDIRSGTFKDDVQLSEVRTGPLQLTSIQKNAFEGCNEVKVVDAYGYCYLKQMHPHGAKKLTLQRMYSNTCLQNAAPSAFMNVKLDFPVLAAPMLVNAGDYAFAYVENLVSADFGNRMHIMPSHCYAYSTNLQHVVVQSNVDVVKRHAFEGCNKLSSIQIIGSRIRLDDYAMNDLTSLKSFDISKVTYVGKHALENCDSISFRHDSLQNITFIGERGLANAIHTLHDNIRHDLNPALLKSIEKNAFAGCDVAGFNAKISLSELDECLSAKIGESLIPSSRDDTESIIRKYSLLKSWLGLTSDFEMILDDFVFNANGSGLDYDCFIYNNSKDKITGLKITEDMFKFIQKPVFPSRAKSIAYNALNVDIFKKSITNVDLNNIASVDVGQFSNCRSLTSFDAPHLAELPDCCLCGCVHLARLKLDSCSSMSQTALHGCNSISSIIIPAAAQHDSLPAMHLSHVLLGAGSSSDIFCEDISKPGRVQSVNDLNVTSENVQMPPTFNNKHEMLSIGGYSMKYTTKITSLTAGQNVVNIEDNAFTDNASIQTVNLTKSTKLSSIGANAFERSALTSFMLPYKPKLGPVVHSYGLNKSASLQSFTAANGYTSVAEDAFADCEPMLSSVQLPTTVTSIGDRAFAERASFFPRIRKINIEQLTSLTSIGDYAFYNSIATQSIDRGLSSKLRLPSSVQHIGAAAFGYSIDTYTQQIEDAEIHAEDIGPSAFMRSHFRNITLDSKLTSIGDYAFANPKYKFTCLIPANVKRIGIGAFRRNVILNPEAIEKNVITCDFSSAQQILCAMNAPLSADFTAPNTVSATDDTVFIAAKAKEYSDYVYVKNNVLNICPDYLSIDILHRNVVSCTTKTTSAFLPAYVYNVGPAAFKDCISLTAISSANETVDVSESAFYGCSNLAGINLPDSFYLSAVPSYAFYGCSSLQNIRVLSNALCIGDYAFAGCKSLKSAQDINSAEKLNCTLPMIGDHAFDGCISLSSFFVPHDISVFGEDVFKSCPSLAHVEIDLDAGQFLSVIDPLNKLSGISNAISAKFRSMNDDAKCAIVFNDAVYMNDGNVKIDDEYVVISAKAGLSAVESLKQEMFLSSGMPYLNLSNIAEVRQFAFRDAQSLEVINFLPGEQQLSSIGDYAFSKCSYLRSVNGNVLSSVSNIGTYAFYGCSLMKKVQIDIERLSSISYGAFHGTGLAQVIVRVPDEDDGMSNIDQYVNKFKSAIGFDKTSNQNPLELPEDCVITFVNLSIDFICGKYDYMMNDLMHADVDINRNQMVFIDKRNNAIKPLLLVRSSPGHLPALVNNQFHMNVIGRWK